MRRQRFNGTPSLKKWCASCGHHADVHPNGPCEGLAPSGKKCPCKGFRERK